MFILYFSPINVYCKQINLSASDLSKPSLHHLAGILAYPLHNELGSPLRISHCVIRKIADFLVVSRNNRIFAADFYGISSVVLRIFIENPQ